MRDRDADCRLIAAQAAELDRLRAEFDDTRHKCAKALESATAIGAGLATELARVRGERDRAVDIIVTETVRHPDGRPSAIRYALTKIVGGDSPADVAAALAEHDRRAAGGD